MKYGLNMTREADDTTSYLGKTSGGLGVTLSEFKLTDKVNYDIKLNTPESTRDTYKLAMGDDLITFYKELIEAYAYPVILIEDRFDQDYWSKWSKFANE